MIKKYLPYIILPVLFVFLAGVIVACTYERGPMKLPTVTISPVQPANQQPQPANDDQKNLYPTTPEAVVQAFLLSLQADPASSINYLSAALRSNLPAEGPTALLAVSGEITGVAIQSGAVSLEPAAAQVDVGLQVAETIVTRRFNMLQEKEHWVITSIDVVE